MSKKQSNPPPPCGPGDRPKPPPPPNLVMTEDITINGRAYKCSDFNDWDDVKTLVLELDDTNDASILRGIEATCAQGCGVPVTICDENFDCSIDIESIDSRGRAYLILRTLDYYIRDNAS